jgi:hypothetical protein
MLDGQKTQPPTHLEAKISLGKDGTPGGGMS